MSELLTLAGHDVTLASDGLEGAQLYRAHPADIVLCDLVMKHSGLTLIRILKDQYPNIRIIAMSGVDQRRLNYAVEYGAMKALRKPFPPDELLATIEQVLAAPAPAVPPPPSEAAPENNPPQPAA